MDPMGSEIVPIELGSIISVYLRPSMQSSQMKVWFGFPNLKDGSCQPGGYWDPGWGVVPKYNPLV